MVPIRNLPEQAGVADRVEGKARRDFLAPDRSVAGVLNLLGTGPGCHILKELGQGPLRTKQLTERIGEFSPRSVYRCVGRMEDYGLVDRYEEPGPPSVVLRRLSEPMGRNLFRLLRSFGPTSGEEMRLVGELWEAGFLDELSREPRSLMDLLGGPHDLTYHQVKRRTHISVDSGLLGVSSPQGNTGLYELTDRGRRHIGLVAGIGRWRHRHVVADGVSGLAPEEMATALRTALPLASLPAHAGMTIFLIVAGAEEYGQREMLQVAGAVGPDGAVSIVEDPEQEADGSATATINTWFAALLDGNRGRIRVRDDQSLVDACLTQLHEVLWDTGAALARSG